MRPGNWPLRTAPGIAALCVFAALALGVAGMPMGMDAQRADNSLSVLRGFLAGDVRTAASAPRLAPPGVSAVPPMPSVANVGATDPVRRPIDLEAMGLSSTVELRRQPVPLSLDPAAATPGLSAGSQVSATVSFYYCEQGDTGFAGDGGGFCGTMRDGSVVRDGAAACDVAYLGQRFRIQGDPTGRMYTCNDTGSAVGGLHRDIWFATASEGVNWLAQVGQVAIIEIVE
ncbi:MAG: hypothetical protein H3C62_15035 [Gemmatimonadaceae bacterium]|nr:hypothetical protein [Gemmatimonadaceae bacterium]